MVLKEQHKKCGERGEKNVFQFSEEQRLSSAANFQICNQTLGEKENPK